jgi:putative acetyltransferase
LREHLDEMHRHSPPESVHALDLDALRAPGISFWRGWEGRTLVGCVALKELDASHGEIKSMRTALAHQGKGVGTQLLKHVLEEATRRGYRRLSLETGSMAHFAPAWSLYARSGFEPCCPFARYVDDSNSVFMTRLLTRA